MKVSQLAKEYGLKSQEILSELKTLKLKSKDEKQELSPAVLAVLKSSLAKKGKKVVPQPKETAKAEPQKKALPKTPVKEIKIEKKMVKAAAKKKTVVKEKSSAVKKAPVKKKIVTGVKEVKKENKLEQPAVVKKDIPVVKEKPVPVKEAAPQQPPAQKILQEKPEIVKIQPLPVKRVPFGQRHKRGGFSKGVFAQPRVQQKLPETVVIGPEKEIEIDIPISIKDLSVKLQQKPSVVLKVLMKRGIFATINQNLNEEILQKITEDLNFTFKQVKTQEQKLVALHKQELDDPALLKHRPPVITFMGHVDHGKTSLLDKIRQSNITDKEHGGITQHMAAYSVKTPRGTITFLDTPGHAAFTAMRARGAHITDLVILVVAADEGVMPQTEEAIGHAKAGGVPIVVAVNKIDKRNADLDRVKKQLADQGLAPEDWGGKTVVAGVSAMTGEGIDHLLEMILLEAELLDLKANYDKAAFGIVVEAHLSHGRGPVASVIVQSGTLKEGDVVVVGPYFGKVKAMFDDHQKTVSQAFPAVPVEILGLSGIPEAGEIFYVVEDEKKAKEIAEKRASQLKNKKFEASQKITLEDLYSQIQQGKIRELNIILKADVQGSLEALRDSLNNLSTEEVKIKFIHTGIGDINAADVILAGVSNAIIVGFHVEIAVKAKDELEKQNIDVRLYRIIYDAVDDLKKALSGLLEPKIKKIFLGQVEIRQVFKLSRSGIVAGCFVKKGRVSRKAKISIMRNGQEVYSGEVDSLKRFKDDVREVREGFECGITIKGFDEVEPGDVIEAFELEKIERTL